MLLIEYILKKLDPKIQILYIFVLFCNNTNSYHTTKAEDEFIKIINQPALQNASISIYAKNLSKNFIIKDYNKNTSLTPASILKIVTAATAIELLGPSFTFKTKIYIRGDIDKDGVLNGDIIIIPGNDASFFLSSFENFYNKFYKEIIEILKEKKISTVKGSIRLKYEKIIPESWTHGNLKKYYATIPSTFIFQGNQLNITIISNHQKITTLSLKPQLPKTIKIINSLSLASSTNLTYVHTNNTLDFKGTIPPNKTVTYKIPNPYPDEAFIYKLKSKLLKNNINVLNEEIDNPLQEQYHIYTCSSPTLKEILKEMISTSNNLIAESVLSQISKYYTKNYFDANRTNTINWFWKNRINNHSGMIIHDGSGLSRKNSISSKNITDILEYMYKSKYNDDYFYVLNNNGSFGAYGNTYFKNKEFASHIFGKAGSLAHINSFTGYMKNKNEDKIAFAIIIENHNCKSRNHILKIIENISHLIMSKSYFSQNSKSQN